MAETSCSFSESVLFVGRFLFLVGLGSPSTEFEVSVFLGRPLFFLAAGFSVSVVPLSALS